MLGRCVEHALEQLPVPGLELLAAVQRLASGADPLRQRVAHPLQLLEAGDTRLTEATGHLGIEVDPGKGLGAQAGELVLEATDLTTQLSASEALVAPHSKRCNAVSIEQIRHIPDSSVNHLAGSETRTRLRNSR